MPISGRPLKEAIAEGKCIVETLSAAHPNWEIINPLDIQLDYPKRFGISQNVSVTQPLWVLT